MPNMLGRVLSVFSTREIAIGIWLLLGLGYIVSKSSVRQSLFQLIGSAAQWKILVPIAAFALYTSAVAAVLARVGLWTGDLLKDTIFWFLFSGTALLFSGLSDEGRERHLWRRLVREQIAITLITEWVISSYTFALGVELVLVPILLMLGAVSAVAGLKPEYAATKNVIGCIIPLVGLAILGSAVAEAVAQFHLNQAGAAFRSMVVPPILSIAAVPMAYVFSVVATTELLLVRLHFALRNDERGALARYTAWAILRRCRFSPRKIRQFWRVYMRNLHGVASRDDVNSVIELSRRSRRGVIALE